MKVQKWLGKDNQLEVDIWNNKYRNCGVDISRLSPRGARINNVAKETTGAVSFMDLYCSF